MRNVLYFALCITLCAAIGCDEPKEGDGGGNNGGGNNGQPAITGQPKGATYQLNEDATPLSVTVENANKPVYQWYVNSSNSNKGGVALDGATSNTYKPSTDIPGTFYYYCVIGDLTSNTAVVTVKDGDNGDDDKIPPSPVPSAGNETSALLTKVYLVDDNIILNYRLHSWSTVENSVTLLGIKAAAGATASAVSSAVFEDVKVENRTETEDDEEGTPLVVTTYPIILLGEKDYAYSGFAKSVDNKYLLQELLLYEGLAVVDDAECNTTAKQTDKNKISYNTYTVWKASENLTPAAGNENTIVDDGK